MYIHYATIIAIIFITFTTFLLCAYSTIENKTLDKSFATKQVMDSIEQFKDGKTNLCFISYKSANQIYIINVPCSN